MGPLRVSHYNNLRMSPRNGFGGSFHGARQESSERKLGLLKPSRLVYYAHPPGAPAPVGRVFGAKFDLSANEVAILGDTQDAAVNGDFCTCDTILWKYATNVSQAHGRFPVLDISDWDFWQHGGGLRPPLMANAREDCAERWSRLVRPRVKALVYGPTHPET